MDSPRLGIRFVVTPETLEVYYPDDSRFLTTIELKEQADSAELELAFIKQFLQQQGIEIPESES